jgi:uncharacterized Zn-binding protein involved in type VI secretion
MPAAIRIGDPTSCGDTIAAGSGNVFINGIPATRLGDATAGHPCGPPTVTNSGAATVFVNGIPLCRVGDTIAPHGTCSGPPHPGSITVGSSDVFVEN